MLPDFTTWLLVMLRIGGLLALFPIFTARHFPARVRLALGALVAALVAPNVPGNGLVGLPFLDLVVRMTIEVLIGLLLGFVSRITFYALDLAGSLIGAEVGLNLPGALNPFAETQTTAPALILYNLAALLYLSLDLHHWLLAAFQQSYLYLPLGGGRLSEALLVDVLRRTSGVFEIAVRMAAPFIAVSFIVTLVFSVLGRAVPQMNVFAESFPTRILAGLIVFGLTTQLLAYHILHYLRRLPEDLLRVVQLLGMQ
ncbi:MAG: flagellar biosynthetic protein FliR [Verrucomicrobia bacterium]|nr:flagellar biosynthetic protein FliR [Verrucomicrobiota bacterium]